MVYLLAIVAALVNGVSSILQRLGVETAPSDAGLSPRLVTHMLSRGVWIAGFFLMGAGFVAQATALHLGNLAIVQPLLVTELVFLVGALWLWYSMPLRGRDIASSIAATLGLAIFLGVANPTSGTTTPTNKEWFIVGAVVLAVIASLVFAGTKGPSWWRALALGAAASVGFALTAALTKSVTDNVTRGWGPLLTSWSTYAVIVVGLGSFFLMQSAFHVGPFAASQSTLILVNPFVSIVIGFVLFNDHLRHGTLAVIVEVLALAVMVVGAVGLTTSPLVIGVHDESPGTHLLAGRGRWARWRARRAGAARGVSSAGQ